MAGLLLFGGPASSHLRLCTGCSHVDFSLTSLTDASRAKLPHWRQWISADTPYTWPGEEGGGAVLTSLPSSPLPAPPHPWLVEIKPPSLRGRRDQEVAASSLVECWPLICDRQTAQGREMRCRWSWSKQRADSLFRLCWASLLEKEQRCIRTRSCAGNTSGKQLCTVAVSSWLSRDSRWGRAACLLRKA